MIKFNDYLIEEAVEYNISNNKPLSECLFRRESEMFSKYFQYLKENKDKLELNEFDLALLETDIGEKGIYEGEEVWLDLPFVEASLKDLSLDRLIKIGFERITKGSKIERAIEVLKDIIDIKLKETGSTVKKPRLRHALGWYAAEVSDVYKLDSKGLANSFIKKHPEYKMTESINEEEKVELNKPKRGGPKKFYVYVKDPQTGNVKKVTFGDTSGLKAKINDPKARASFAARHKCAQKTDKTSPGYWACRLPRYAKQLGLEGGGGGFW